MIERLPTTSRLVAVGEASATLEQVAALSELATEVGADGAAAVAAAQANVAWRAVNGAAVCSWFQALDAATAG